MGKPCYQMKSTTACAQPYHFHGRLPPPSTALALRRVAVAATLFVTIAPFSDATTAVAFLPYRGLHHDKLGIWRSESCKSPRQPRFLSDVDAEEEASSWYLTPPESLEDFFKLGSLLVETFDEDAGNDEGFVGDFLRKGLQSVAVRRYANKYASTVRKMRGKKHTLILAKDRSDDSVVGMVEMGVSAYGGPSPREVVPTTSVIKPDEDGDASSHPPETMSTRVGEVVASIGVLAVSPSYRRSGIGCALVIEAVGTAGRRWSKQSLHAAVEPSNEKALKFFRQMGFEEIVATTTTSSGGGFETMASSGGDGNSGDEYVLVEVPVQDLWRTEGRPHLLLRKSIEEETIEEDETMEAMDENEETKKLIEQWIANE